MPLFCLFGEGPCHSPWPAPTALHTSWLLWEKVFTFVSLVLSDLVSTCHLHYSRPYPPSGKHQPLTLPHLGPLALQAWCRVLGPVLTHGSQDMEWDVPPATHILAMLPVP